MTTWRVKLLTPPLPVIIIIGYWPDERLGGKMAVGVRSVLQLFDLLLKLLTVAEGTVFDACTVVVDGVDGIVQELGNL